MKILFKYCTIFAILSLFTTTVWAQIDPLTGERGKVVTENNYYRVTKIDKALPDNGQMGTQSQQSQQVAPRKFDEQTDVTSLVKIPITRIPLWERLEKLSFADKENATIQLEFSENLNLAQIEQLEGVEELWNSGSFELAIEQLRNWEQSENYQPISMGISWKTPRPVQAPTMGTDVQIGSRLDVGKGVLDFDAETGNLFAVLLRTTGDDPDWTVYVSYNNGLTWSETFYWNSGYGGDI